MQHEVDKCVLTAHTANVCVSDVCRQLGDPPMGRKEDFVLDTNESMEVTGGNLVFSHATSVKSCTTCLQTQLRHWSRRKQYPQIGNSYRLIFTFCVMAESQATVWSNDKLRWVETQHTGNNMWQSDIK